MNKIHSKKCNNRNVPTLNEPYKITSLPIKKNKKNMQIELKINHRGQREG